MIRFLSISGLTLATIFFIWLFGLLQQTAYSFESHPPLYTSQQQTISDSLDPIGAYCTLTKITDRGGENQAGNSQPTISGDGKNVAFWSNYNYTQGRADDNVELYIYHTGSATFTQVTSTTGNVVQGYNISPAIDKDGSTIAFISDQDTNSCVGENPERNFELFKKNIESTAGSCTQVSITNDKESLDPTVSDPDVNGKRKIVFSQSNRKDANKQIVEPEKFLPKHSAYLPLIVKTSPPFVTPTIATITPDDPLPPSYQLYLYDETDPEPIKPKLIEYTTAQGKIEPVSGKALMHPEIDPSGEFIVFASHLKLDRARDNHKIQQIYLYNIEEKTFVQLSNSTNGSTNQPTISRDGKRIVYVYNKKLFYVERFANGSYTSPKVINFKGNDNTDNYDPAISGNGERLIFTSSLGDSEAEIYLYNFSGNRLWSVGGTRPNKASSQPDISENGQQIVFASNDTLIDGDPEMGTREIYLAQCGQINLDLKKSAEYATIVPGKQMDYFLEVTNQSQTAAGKVEVIDELPEGVSYISGPCKQKGQQVTCLLGTIEGKTSKEVAFKVEVSSTITQETVITNVARVSGYLPNISTRKQATATTVVEGYEANLVIDSTSYAPPTSPLGKPIAYTITIRNNGPSNATDIIFTDALPVPSRIIPPYDEQCDIRGQKWECELDDLPPNATASINLVTDPILTTGWVTNTITVTSKEASNKLTYIQTTNVFNSNETLYLSIYKTEPASVSLNEEVTYFIHLQNGSATNPAQNVVLTNIVSDYATYVDCRGCNITTLPNQQLVWEMGAIEAHGVRHCEITMRLSAFPPNDRLVNDVTARGTFAGRVVTSQDREVTEVNRDGDLQVSKTGSKAIVSPNEQLIYTISITNLGRTAIPKGITIDDDLPISIKNTTYQLLGSNDDKINGRLDKGHLYWQTEKEIGAGEVLDYSVVVTMPGLSTGFAPTITNRVTVFYENDPNLKNNSDDYSNHIGGRIGGRIWHDYDADGRQDNDETDNVLEPITVALYDARNDEQPLMTTQSTGTYTFTQVKQGSYYLSFSKPNNYHFSPPNKDIETDDSNVVNFNVGKTAPFTLTAGTFDSTHDVGLYQKATFITYIWEDKNGDGTQTNETNGLDGLANVTPQLIRAGTTDAPINRNSHSGGVYTFTDITPGRYSLKVNKPDNSYNYTCQDKGSDDNDSDASPLGETATFVITSGQTYNNWDVGLYRFATIGDFVWNDTDANQIFEVNEIGRANVTVELTKITNTGCNTEFSETVGTDTNGFYTINNIPPGQYQLKFSQPLGHEFSVPEKGTFENFVVISGQNDTTRDAGVYIPGGVGNRVWLDVNANGVEDEGEQDFTEPITIKLINSADKVKIITTTNGTYSFAVAPDTYRLQFINPDPTKYKFSNLDSAGNTNQFTILQGEIQYHWDAGIYEPAGFKIGDLVWLDDGDGIYEANEPGVENVQVELYAMSDEGIATWVASTVTNPNGEYGFIGVEPGTYYLHFMPPNQYSFSPHINDSTPNPETGKTPNFVLSEDNPQALNWDAGLTTSQGGIGDFVWFDANADGQQVNFETGFPEPVTVELYNTANQLVTATTTSATGYYNLVAPPGRYYLRFVNPDPTKYTFSTPNSGNDSIDSDPNPANGITDFFDLVTGQQDNSWDAGLHLHQAAIGDFVWLDSNADGIQNLGESGLAGVRVALINAQTNQPYSSTVTTSNGYYQFQGYSPGTYYLQFTPPVTGDYRFSPKHIGNDITVDSDVGISGRSDNFVVPANELIPNFNLDAGLYQESTLRLEVWNDNNADGTQDNGEPAMPDAVEVVIYKDITPFDTVLVTDILIYPNLTPGSYRVEFNKPANWAYSPLGSPVNVGNFNLASGETITKSQGYHQKAAIEGFVWHDKFPYGKKFDPTDDAYLMESVAVRLLKNGVPLAISPNPAIANPDYEFLNLEPGTGYQLQFQSPVVGIYNAYSTTVTFDLSSGQTFLQNMGYTATGSTIEGVVWNDSHNPNGQRIPGNNYNEPDISSPSLVVTLFNSDNTIFRQDNTQNGRYSFTDVPAGSYYLHFELLSGYTYTKKHPNNNIIPTNNIYHKAYNPDGKGIGTTKVFPTISGINIVDVYNAGYNKLPIITGYAWHDEDGQGDEDLNEDLLTNTTGITVALYQGTSLKDVGTIDSTGRYTLTAPNIGSNYHVRFGRPPGYIHTTPINGKSNSFDLNNFGGNASVNVGYAQLAHIKGFVWYDSILPIDGTKNNSENGMPIDVTVELYRVGTPTPQQITTTKTTYTFNDVAAGYYYLRFIAPTGYTNTITGTHHKVISSTNRTKIFPLNSGQTINRYNAGYYQLGTVTGYVWHDTDIDGEKDTGEGPITYTVPGVTVRLFDDSDVLIDQMTNVTNTFTFRNIASGTYYLRFEERLPDYRYTISGPQHQIDNSTGKTPNFIITLNMATPLSFTAGYTIPTVITGILWHDLNLNGLIDGSENEWATSASVSLYQNGVDLNKNATTDPNGMFTFNDVSLGTNYTVVLENSPTNYNGITTETGNAGTLTDTFPITSTANFDIIQSGETISGKNIGLFKYARIEGEFAKDEPPRGDPQNDILLDGAVITLTVSITATQVITYIHSGGLYKFDNLMPDPTGLNYTIAFSNSLAYPNYPSPLDVNGQYVIPVITSGATIPLNVGLCDISCP